MVPIRRVFPSCLLLSSFREDLFSSLSDFFFPVTWRGSIAVIGTLYIGSFPSGFSLIGWAVEPKLAFSISMHTCDSSNTSLLPSRSRARPWTEAPRTTPSSAWPEVQHTTSGPGDIKNDMSKSDSSRKCVPDGHDSLMDRWASSRCFTKNKTPLTGRTEKEEASRNSSSTRISAAYSPTASG